jgi:hypothetical protein
VVRVLLAHGTHGAAPVADPIPVRNEIFWSLKTVQPPRSVVRDPGKFQGSRCSARGDAGTTLGFSHGSRTYSHMNSCLGTCSAPDFSPARLAFSGIDSRLVCPVEGGSCQATLNRRRERDSPSNLHALRLQQVGDNVLPPFLACHGLIQRS